MLNTVGNYYFNLFKTSINRFFFNSKNFGIKTAFMVILSEYSYFYMFKNYKISQKIRLKQNEVVCNVLSKKFSDLINEYKDKDFGRGINQKKIWCFWWQGFDNAPIMVKKCVDSIEKYSGDYELIILNKDNYSDYIDIPDEILDKVESGAISITHFSDILRNGLLSLYGGVWIDSTMYVCDYVFSEFDDIAFNSNWKWNTFFIGGESNKIFSFLYDFLVQYCLKYDEFISYFLMDHIFEIAYNTFADCKELMDNTTFKNTHTFYFLNNFQKPYNEQEFKELCEKYKFFKLSYKPSHNYSILDENGNYTYYGYFLEKL